MPKGKRAYRYRFYPTEEQTHNLACTFGCARFIYNWALQRRKRAYFDHGKKLKTSDLSAALTALKQEEGTAWLRQVSSVPLQQALRHLDAAYTNFFEGRADYPTFKKKHHEQSATYTDNAFTLKGDQLTLSQAPGASSHCLVTPLPPGSTALFCHRLQRPKWTLLHQYPGRRGYQAACRDRTTSGA